jgi:hypothetical protein
MRKKKKKNLAISNLSTSLSSANTYLSSHKNKRKKEKAKKTWQSPTRVASTNWQTSHIRISGYKTANKEV